MSVPAQPRLLFAALAFAVAGHAAAALFDDEEARKRIDATNQRLAQVQRQLEDRIAALEAQMKSQGLVDLFNQVEQLKADAARLRGQIEVLTYEQEQQQKRQRDLYVDLDSRLRKLESGPAPTAAVEDGCYRQVEYAGVLRGARNADGARRLVVFGNAPRGWKVTARVMRSTRTRATRRTKANRFGFFRLGAPLTRRPDYRAVVTATRGRQRVTRTVRVTRR